MLNGWVVIPTLLGLAWLWVAWLSRRVRHPAEKVAPVYRDAPFIYEDRFPKNGWPVSIRNRGGVSWFDAPAPPRAHKCRVQTDAWSELTQVWRCACGAIALPRKGERVVWVDRNSKRTS